MWRPRFRPFRSFGPKRVVDSELSRLEAERNALLARSDMGLGDQYFAFMLCEAVIELIRGAATGDNNKG